MTTPSQSRGLAGGSVRDCGSALITVMFCLMIVTLVSAGMSTMIRNDMQANRTIVQRIKALEIADGAAHQALAMIALTPDQPVSLPSSMASGTLGEGTYTVQQSEVAGGVVALLATGRITGATQRVKVYAKRPSFFTALSKGIFSNGSIDISGNGLLRNGSHSNQSTIVWGSCEVQTGAVDSAGTSTTGGAADIVSGQVNSSVPRVTLPELDFDYYFNIARTNGQVYVGDKTLKGTYAPPGGVMWVVGNVTINATTEFTGMLVATGDIYQAGKCTQTPVNNMPALVSRNGKIDLQGNGSFHGLIYTHSGIVDIHGNSTIKGSIMSWGNVLCRGNWGLIDYEETTPQLLDDPRVKVLAWEN